MGDSADETNYREAIGFFFNEIASPFTAIKAYSQILELYLAALKQHDNSPIALNNTSQTKMTPEMAHHMIEIILHSIQRHEDIVRKLRDHVDLSQHPDDTEQS